MPQQLGTLNVPLYESLPTTSTVGQLAVVNNTIWQWDSTQWVPLWPVFIQTTPPATPSQKYLWVNTSGGAGTNATLWVEDGSGGT